MTKCPRRRSVIEATVEPTQIPGWAFFLAVSEGRCPVPQPPVLDEVASEIAVLTAKAENPDVTDPATRFGIAEILLIVQLITALVRMYKACKKTSAEAHRAMQAPSVWHKFRLRLLLWRHGGTLPQAAVYSALLDWGYMSTFGQVTRLYAAVPDPTPSPDED